MHVTLPAPTPALSVGLPDGWLVGFRGVEVEVKIRCIASAGTKLPLAVKLDCCNDGVILCFGCISGSLCCVLDFISSIEFVVDICLG